MKDEKTPLDEATEDLYKDIDKLLASKNLSDYEVENFRIAKKRKKKCYEWRSRQVKLPDGNVVTERYRIEIPC